MHFPGLELPKLGRGHLWRLGLEQDAALPAGQDRHAATPLFERRPDSPAMVQPQEGDFSGQSDLKI